MRNGDYLIGISPMKQQFATHRYTVLQETAVTGQIVNRLTLKYVMFCYENIRRSRGFFWGGVDTTSGLKECVTQLSSNARISVWRIVWVTTNCCFLSDIFLISPVSSECLCHYVLVDLIRLLIFIEKLHIMNCLTIKFCPSSHFFLSVRTWTLLSSILSSTQFFIYLSFRASQVCNIY